MGHHGHQGHHGHGVKHDYPSINYQPPVVNYDPPTIQYESPTVNYQPPAVNYQPPAVNYEPPAVNYEPPSTNFEYTPTYNHDVPSLTSGQNIPQVRGVVHTIKQVKVFDSLPGAIPGAGPNTGHGYQVTEEGNDDEDDVFTAVNTLPQTFSGTYGFIRNAAAAPQHDFTDLPHQGSQNSNNHDPFAASIVPTAFSNLETFTNNDVKEPSAPEEFSGHIEGTNGFDDVANVIIGSDMGSRALLATSGGLNDETPVSFSRVAGFQESVKTGGLETVEY
ncbi:unnamed protein product [Leptidea sinapis]|uniref:Uncharacterized protein n=1 Tax=Leptidea sinapis TaxID=189913 RepID=A0A5E4QWN0_9NEOP|nr:unnamed protein product [Leptidea sinapis]